MCSQQIFYVDLQKFQDNILKACSWRLYHSADMDYAEIL